MEIVLNCPLSHKGIMLLMLPLTCKGLATWYQEFAFNVYQYFMVLCMV